MECCDSFYNQQKAKTEVSPTTRATIFIHKINKKKTWHIKLEFWMKRSRQ